MWRMKYENLLRIRRAGRRFVMFVVLFGHFCSHLIGLQTEMYYTHRNIYIYIYTMHICIDIVPVSNHDVFIYINADLCASLSCCKFIFVFCFYFSAFWQRLIFYAQRFG